MKPYPKYKDSGIEWIEEVPEDWPILRLKYFIKINPSKSSTVLNENISGEVSFLPMEKVDSDGKYDIASMKPIEEVNNGFTCFKKNDVIFAKITPCFEHGKGALLDKIKTNIGFGSTEFHVLRSIRNMSNSKYLYYITKTHPFRKMGEAFMSGSAGQKRVPSSFIENLFFPYSPLPEQKRIAKYLDHKTAKIDSLIEKKKRLIELLKEERTAVINQAVTKGLDPDVPMKDSGIEWLGEIPEHWGKARLKHLVSDKITDGPHETPEFIDEGVPFLSAEAIKVNRLDFNSMRGYISREQSDIYAQKSKVVKNDILFCKSGSTTGKSALVTDDREFSIWSPLAIIRADKNIINYRYLFTFIQAKAFTQQVETSWSFGTQPNIGMSALENLCVSVPPIPEQRQIAKYLDEEISRIDSIISKSKKEITLLQEYRTALISEVVTGKIDVREEKI